MLTAAVFVVGLVSVLFAGSAFLESRATSGVEPVQCDLSELQLGESIDRGVFAGGSQYVAESGDTPHALSQRHLKLCEGTRVDAYADLVAHAHGMAAAEPFEQGQRVHLPARAAVD